MTRIELIVLSLVRSAFGEEIRMEPPSEAEWSRVCELASMHGLGAISFDGIQANYLSNPVFVSSLDTPSNKSLKYDWFGTGLSAEVAYEKHLDAIADLAALYTKNGIKMMLLKGYGLSLNYPIPEHRPTGDIDVYLFGLGKKADEVVQLQTGTKVKQNGDKHSTFQFEGVSVENHASYINAKVHPDLVRLDVCLKSEAALATPLNMKTKSGETVTIYLPSLTANALFLPFHCASHFVHGEASLRQLCDWACFVRKYGREINWSFVWEEAVAAGFDKFYCCLNGIVNRYLSVSEDVLPSWPRYPSLEEKVLCEVFSQGPEKKRTLIGKIHRFFASSWRYRLVFHGSMFKTFFRLAKSYLRFNDESARSIWES